MGAQNVSKVFALWRCLPDQPFRALTFMALRSMDADNPPKYWGGRDAIAEGLGHTLPADGDASPEAEEVRSRAHRSVKRALSVLQNEGAIATVQAAAFRRNAVYEIRLREAVDNSSLGATQTTPKGSEKETPKGTTETPLKGSTELQLGVASVAPWGPLSRTHRSTRNKEDQSTGTKRGTNPTPSLDSPSSHHQPGKSLTDSFSDIDESQTPAEIETERNRQLTELEKMIGSQKEAS